MDAGDPDGNSILFQLLFLAFLTLVNAFFAGAEMAVVSVNKNRIKVLADEGSKRAALLQTLFEDSTKFLSTIQVAITLADFLKCFCGNWYFTGAGRMDRTVRDSVQQYDRCCSRYDYLILFYPRVW